MTASSRRIWLGIAGVAISVAALWWVLADVHWSEVRGHIADARLLPLLATVVAATATFPLRLFRWQFLLRRENGGSIPLAPLWHAVAIGFMANNILPFRMGEVMRSLSVSRLANVRFTAAFSSVAVERVFDGLTVVGLLVVSLFAAGLPAAHTDAAASAASAPLKRPALLEMLPYLASPIADKRS